jgi:hypothetical protein
LKDRIRRSVQYMLKESREGVHSVILDYTFCVSNVILEWG